MRVINLDTTGIKLISSSRKAIYLSKSDIKDLLNKKYNLNDNTLSINNKQLALTDIDLSEFDNTLKYISSNFGE